MKKIMFTCYGLFFVSMAGADTMHRVCGVDTLGRDYAYTVMIDQENKLMGSWAVGDDCGNGGVTENIDISTMCTTVVAGGHGFCGTTLAGGGVAGYGNYCWCRRMRMLVDDELKNSVGQWVMLGDMGGSCNDKCAMYCAENVANNIGGMHHAIMVLPAI